jgi:ABC-type Fe3+/spermidine/putrescine transport system ATPase subunit
VYEFPNSSFVAEFVGATNILQGTLQLSEAGAQFAVEGLGTFEALPPQKEVPTGKTVLMSLRPEKIEISKKEQSGFSNMLKGTVDSIIYHGRSTQYDVLLANGTTLHVFEQNEHHFVNADETIDYDDVVYLYWQKENAILLER